jgi:hypothetical protein
MLTFEESEVTHESTVRQSAHRLRKVGREVLEIQE